jgi:hypothetical protein
LKPKRYGRPRRDGPRKEEKMSPGRKLGKITCYESYKKEK